MGNSPVIFLACKVFEGLIRRPAGVQQRFLDYGLHTFPKKLKQAVQEQIDALEQPSIVVLGYGLCGNGLDQIRAGMHTLIIPKADDCVAIFMGSRQRYLEQFDAQPGTYYLTKGWFEVGSDPLSESERLLEKYGPETTEYLMQTQYRHYKHLLFVAHSQADLDAYRPRALEVAAYCERFGMVYSEYLGSTDFVDQLADVIDRQQIRSDQFIVVSPGNTLRQELFR